MPDAASQRDIMAETMAQGRKSLIPHLAEMLKRDAIAEVPPDEERRRFWTPVITDEQEAQRWQEEMQQRGLTPEMASDPAQAEDYLKQMTDIGLKLAREKYPDRFDMMAGEGRDTQAKQADWAWTHLKAGPPKAMQEGEQDGSGY
jgi:hypothetical protein